MQINEGTFTLANNSEIAQIQDSEDPIKLSREDARKLALHKLTERQFGISPNRYPNMVLSNKKTKQLHKLSKRQRVSKNISRRTIKSAVPQSSRKHSNKGSNKKEKEKAELFYGHPTAQSRGSSDEDFVEIFEVKGTQL